MFKQFADWLPDRAPLGSVGATTARNVIPAIDGYEPVRAIGSYTDAIGAQCIGSAAFRDDADNVYLYAGTTTKLYETSSSSWSEVTNATEDYEVSSYVQWEFVQWDTDKVIATAYYDGSETGTAVTFPQSKVMGTGNFANMITDPVPGTTPFRAAHVCVARDFVVFGNVEYNSVHYPNRVWWTGINDETTITPSSVTQADYQDLQGSGKVQRVVGGESLAIICETNTYRYDYSGAPEIWSLTYTHNGLGTPYPWSVVSFQSSGMIWMWSREGFVEFSPGGSVKWIGKEKVDNYFRENIEQGYAHRISAAKDHKAHRVYWAFPSIGSATGIPDKILCYDYVLEKWSLIVQNVEVLMSVATGGVTIDDAIFQIGGEHEDLDAMTISLDSPIWKAGLFQLAAFNTSHKLGVFDGDTLSAVVETEEKQLLPSRRSIVSSVRPIVDGSCSVSIGTRAKTTQSPTWVTAVTPDDTGKCDFRVNGRYHRFRITTTGEYHNLQGVDIEFSQAGDR